MAKQHSIFDGAWEKRATDLWMRLDKLWGVAEEHCLMSGQITELRIKRPRYEGDETMVIVKALTDEGAFVAFSTGIDTPGALAGALARAEQGQLKWRPDEFAQTPPKALGQP